ncbi:MAG: hypothetical protein ACK559_26225, partial [bacterium]
LLHPPHIVELYLLHLGTMDVRKTGKMPLNQLSGKFQVAYILGLSSLLHNVFGPLGWILHFSAESRASTKEYHTFFLYNKCFKSL